MAVFTSLSVFCVYLIILHGLMLCGADENRQVYIVYMGSLPEKEYSPTDHHFSILQEVVEGSSVDNVLLRSYKRSFNGFAAKLTDKEQKKIASMDGVVSVFPREFLKPQTTRSWDFMGFTETVKRNPSIESDIVIGILDNGIWPESKSFSDKGFGPPPKKWKGICQKEKNFTCNNKVIGARKYSNDKYDKSVRDSYDGHGTYSASIAAGNIVKGVDYYGLAKGNARGAVPSARIASYKFCYSSFYVCPTDLAMAAFDDAIADGVDIITISITYGQPKPFAQDVVAIGAFHAMEKGIITVQAAGNFGPNSTTVASVAPWILSVGASSIDRKFINEATLGNKTTLTSDAINTYEAEGTLIYGRLNTSFCPEIAGRNCDLFCLDEKLVKGKIVVCDRGGGHSEAYRTGAIGSLSPAWDTFIYKPLPFPAYGYKGHEGDLIKAYMNSTKNPHVKISKSWPIKNVDAPDVPGFSSRGPNPIVPDFIKPDLVAPGLEILAAFSPTVPPSRLTGDKRFGNYTLLSGTSVSAPHAAGAAAYVKSFHPDWSPAAVKSALMTTAWPMNASKIPEAEFAYGAGHIDPVKAINPGLVYESLEGDYIHLLCSMGFDTAKLRVLTKHNSTCPSQVEGSPKDFNYPSIGAQVQAKKAFALKIPRTATNVGKANSTYKAQITTGDSKIKIDVVPSVLSFSSLKEKKSFSVNVAGNGLPENSMVSASLVWSDGTHNVRSPIVVYTNMGPKIL